MFPAGCLHCFLRSAFAKYEGFVAGSARNCSKIEKQKLYNEQMLTDVRQPGQLIVSDQMFIASTSCQAFANAFVSSAIISHIHFQT